MAMQTAKTFLKTLKHQGENILIVWKMTMYRKIITLNDTSHLPNDCIY